MLDHPTYIFHTSWLHCIGISCSDFDPSGNLVRGTNIPGISFRGINIPIKAARQIGPNLGNLVQALLSSSRMFICMFYWVCCMRTRSTYCTDEWKKDSAVPPNGKAAIHSPRESQWKPYSTCMHVAECNFQKVSFTRDEERIKSSKIHWSFQPLQGEV